MLKIFTFAHKRPDFIELQLKSFRKYLREDFEFTVFNNAAFDQHPGSRDSITKECARLSLNEIKIGRDELLTKSAAQYSVGPVFLSNGMYHNANVACAYPLCWAWQRISKESGPICILDSDMFLVEPITLTDYLKEHDLCFVSQAREHIRYAWNGIILANPHKLEQPETLNWWCGQVDGVPVDVGGQTYRYFIEHPTRIMHIGPESFYEDPSVDFQPSAYEVLHLGDKTILHYRSGSNWNHQTPEYHRKKTAWLLQKVNL
jgi:hypothetical protein